MADGDCGDMAERYEFDAPSHVVDFQELQTNENDDTWFDKLSSGHANNMPLGPNQVEEGSKPRAIVTPLQNKDVPRTTAAEVRPKTKTPAESLRVPKRKAPESPQRSPVKRYKKSPVPLPARRPTTELRRSVRQKVKTDTNNSASKSGLERAQRRQREAAMNRGKNAAPNASVSKKTLQQEAYVPMAQRILQFQTRTPERFRLRSRQNGSGGSYRIKLLTFRAVAGQAKSTNLKLTHPHSPNLKTSKRSRPTTTKSSAELEAEQMEELQKHQFKAQELPKKILGGVVGVPDKKAAELTVPESPAFILSKRVRVEPKLKEVKPPSPFKAPPVPHFGTPFLPVLPDVHNIEVCPFSFEQREQEKKKLKEKAEKPIEVPKFKAQPLPDFDTVVLPEKKKLEPTKPEPFKLLVDERGAVKSRHLEVMVKEELKKIKDAASFKAKPNVVAHKEPFLPKKENRAPVATDIFELATERRARERQQFEELATQKESLRAQMEEEQRRRREEEEKDEIARLRQEQVHKACPVRHYKAVEVKKSEAPLTIPKSPNFSSRFRS
ncbi:targeting protein for Xklp2 [Neosynchiropus ocellatus]